MRLPSWWSARGKSGPLVVPSRFNRNSRNVTALMGPEESGRWLLERVPPAEHVRDDRFSYIFLDGYHALYNPRGRALSLDTTLPLPAVSVDLVCMFSVITHQNPGESQCIFSMLRRCIRAEGHLFFACFLDECVADFEDRSPKRNGGRCFYNPEFPAALVERCGWRLGARAPGDGPLIGDSFVGRAA